MMNFRTRLTMSHTLRFWRFGAPDTLSLCSTVILGSVLPSDRKQGKNAC